MGIKAKIQFLTGDQKGKVVNVEKLPLLIGRVEGCDIVLAGDAGVSRKHAELRSDGGRVIVTDLGSSGGTTVNQQKIAGEQPLKAGDVIGVGKYQLRIALPAPKSGAAPAKAKVAEDQEGTAFVDMSKMMAAGAGQEGTAFVDMDQFVEEGGGGGQEGTAVVDMSRLAKKPLGEKWRELPRKKKVVLGSAGGLVVLLLVVALVAALQPPPKTQIFEDEAVIVTVDGTRALTIPRAKEVSTTSPDIVIAWLDEDSDSVAHLMGVEEGEAQLYVTTREGDTHIWNVGVEGYEDPYKGFTAQQRLDKGMAALAVGDEKAKLSGGDPEKSWYAYVAYRDAYQYLSGAQFALPERVKEAETKKLEVKAILDEARVKYESEFDRARQMEQWDAVILALEALTRIYPDREDPRHMRYMYMIRHMKERRAGR